MYNRSQPKVDMHKLKMINEKYNFKVKQIRPDLVMVKTWCGEWYVEVNEPSVYDKKYIIVKHKNTRFNTKREHEQRRFYDYEWALGHINNHDNRRFGLRYNKK